MKGQWYLILFSTILAIGLTAAPGYATWSIIIVDPETKEVAIGSATCLATYYDLMELSPVVIVDVGGACAQAMIDFSENNREQIARWMVKGVPPDEIIERLSEDDFFHEERQYGIVDTQGRAATFTGSGTSEWAGGLTGQAGSLVYAIQGNILVDSTVVYEAEAAIRNTPGDIPEKLMAAMEAARDRGGDSRCTEYGKSAHIGYMVMARPGDIDGTCGEGDGCANGDYVMSFDIAYQNIDDPDPVDQLREAFDAWREDLIGRPDAVQSLVGFDTASIPPNGGSPATMTISLRDWQGEPVTAEIESVTVGLAEDSDSVTLVRPPGELGGGEYASQVWGLESEGVDRYIVRADDGTRPVQLTPDPAMTVEVPPGGFEIHPPEPGIAGEINEVCVSGGTPGAGVRFFFGREEGQVDTPCGRVGIGDPVVLGEATVGEDGRACLSQMVDEIYQGTRVRIQAVQVPGCDRSNVVEHEFE